MSKENTAGLGINNFYGVRNTKEGASGVVKTEGGKNEFIIEITGSQFVGGVNSYVDGWLPAGAKPVSFRVDVTEAFALGGTTPSLRIGTVGSEATNGLSINEATLEAVAQTTSTTFAGTWANKLAAPTRVGVTLAGTSPTITSAGSVKVIIEYVKY